MECQVLLGMQTGFGARGSQSTSRAHSALMPATDAMPECPTFRERAMPWALSTLAKAHVIECQVRSRLCDCPRLTARHGRSSSHPRSTHASRHGVCASYSL